jgi:hypothetical protein
MNNMYKPKKLISPEEHKAKLQKLAIIREENAKEERKIILSNHRHIEQDIQLSNIGYLRVQIIYNPSFSVGYIWDFREKYLLNSYKIYDIYESTLLDKNTIQAGYTQVHIAQPILALFFDKLNQLQLPLLVSDNNMMGLDGISYGLNIYTAFMQSIKIRWWETPVSEWRILDNLIKEYIEIFLKIPDTGKIVLK